MKSRLLPRRAVTRPDGTVEMKPGKWWWGVLEVAGAIVHRNSVRDALDHRADLIADADPDGVWRSRGKAQLAWVALRINEGDENYWEEGDAIIGVRRSREEAEQMLRDLYPDLSLEFTENDAYGSGTTIATAGPYTLQAVPFPLDKAS
jgi:hypothetical protein